MRTPATALIATLLFASACDDVLFGAEEVVITSSGLPAVEALVEAEGCLGCHNAASALGDLDLETDVHAATVGVVGAYGMPIVEPNDPAGSMFYLKITNTQGDNEGTDMPPGSGGIAAENVTIVEDWINDGAPAE